MPFNEWLTHQTQRHDAVGCLTRQLIHDSTSPLWSSKVIIYHQYFEKRGANAETLAAFEDALSEWRDGNRKPESGKHKILIAR